MSDGPTSKAPQAAMPEQPQDAMQAPQDAMPQDAQGQPQEQPQYAGDQTMEEEDMNQYLESSQRIEQMIQALADKIDQNNQMETHIVRGQDGKASHTVKRMPEQEMDAQ